MSTTVPFVDLKRQYAQHREEFERALLDVCSSASFILGPDLNAFENEFANFIGVRHAVGVGNGTDALRLACIALGVGKGDEVLVPANTFIATAIAVHQVGATPIPVDIDPETYLMDLMDAERRITANTRAMIPVHLYGQAHDMDALTAFSSTHNLIVIEDACQAHGAAWKDRRAGSFGAANCFSFYPGKNMGAFGDGGMITTDDDDLAHQFRLMRNWGGTQKYLHEIIGGNSRLDTLHAAVLRVKLGFLDAWNGRRFRAACRYADGLAGLSEITVPTFDRDHPNRHVFHLFVIQHAKRDALAEHLNAQGIQCGIHYPVPIHLHAAFAHLGKNVGSCPVAEELADRILSLPMFPEITDREIDTVVEALRTFHA